MAGYLTYSTIATVASTNTYLNWALESGQTNGSLASTTTSTVTLNPWSTSNQGETVTSASTSYTASGSTSGQTGSSNFEANWTTGLLTQFRSFTGIVTLTSTNSVGLDVNVRRSTISILVSTGVTQSFSYTEPGFTLTSSGVFNIGTNGSTVSITSQSGTIVTLETSTTSASSTLEDSTSTTSGTTTGTAYHSAMTVTSTETVNLTNSNVTSTQSAPTTTTRWTAAGGLASRTTYTTGTTVGVLSSLTLTGNTTFTTTQSRNFTTVSAFLIGTGFLASANGFQSDLPAWLIGSAWAGGIAGSWNYSFNTGGATYPVLPSATTGPVSTTATSAIAHPASFTLAATTTLTVFGTSSFTTTSDQPAPFTNTESTSVGVTAQVPLSSPQQTVTTWASFTQTYTTTFTTPYNTVISGATTTVVTSQNVGGLPSSHNGTRTTVFTLATVVAGYTTAAATLGIGGGAGLVSTMLISGPGLSATTTTLSGLWWYDWSCPTALLSSGNTTSTASSSSTSSPSTTSSTGGTTSSGSPTVATGFVQNLFAQPYELIWPVATINTTSAVAPSPAVATVKVWSATPIFQGFSPWSATSLTYQTIQAPAGVSQLSFGAMETGSTGSFSTDSTFSGWPVTTTSWGLWGLLAGPHTTTVTTTVTSTTSASPGSTTLTQTWTQVDSWTASNSFSNASSTAVGSIAWPPGMAESAASFSVSTTYTTSTTASPGTTTASESSTYTGFTFTTAPISSTFAESATWSTQTAVNIPGVGGTVKLGAGAATIWAINAAISLFWNSMSTWSNADFNLFGIVIGGTATTSSSTTSDLGAGAFRMFTLPGQASMISSPAVSMTTSNTSQIASLGATGALVPAGGTRFWLTPDTRNIPAPPNLQDD